MDAVSENFLEEEARASVPGLDPLDRARFARLVRQSVACWTRHPRASVRVTRGKYGMALQFEGPLGGKVISVFALKAMHSQAEYRFTGPNSDRKRLGLSKDALEILERLRYLYDAMLSTNGVGGGDVTVTAKLAGKNFPDLVPLVEETRRVLDGGPDGSTAAPARASSDSSTRRPASPARPDVGGKSASAAAPAASEGGAASAVKSDQPLLGAVLELACPDPKECDGFYRQLLGMKSQPRKKRGEPYRFDLGFFVLALCQELSTEEKAERGHGNVAKNRGWGSSLLLKVPDYKATLARLAPLRDAIIKTDDRRRLIVLRDPAGYVVRLKGS